MTGSPIRFTGLVSGMDTQSMVNQLMRAESMRMDRLTRRRQTLQWRRDDMRNTMTTLNNFRNDRTDFVTRGGINNIDSWNTMRSTATPASGAGTVSVRATSSAQQGSFDIRVRQTAQGDFVRGSQFRGTTAGTTATNLQNVNLNSNMRDFLVNANTGEFYPSIIPENHFEYVSIGDANIRLNASDSVQQFIDRVNNNSATGVTMGFDAARGVFTMEARGTGANALVRTGKDRMGFLEHIGLSNIRSAEGLPGTAFTGTAPAGTILGSTRIRDVEGLDNPGSIVINERTFTVLTNETFQGFMTRVNNDPYAGVTMSFNNGRFSIVSDDGRGIETDANPLLNFMGLGGLDKQTDATTTGVTTGYMPIGSHTVFSGITGDMSVPEIFEFLDGVHFTALLDDFDGSEPIEIRIGTATLNVDATTTVGYFLAWANGNADTGITVQFNHPANTLTIRATDPDGTIYIGDDDSGILGLFGITPEVRTDIANANRVSVTADDHVTPAPDATLSQFLTDSNGAAITGESTIQINGHTITVDADDTFQDLMDAINNTAGIGVQMSFNQATGQFVLTPTSAGNAQVRTNEPADGFGVLDFMGLNNIDWGVNDRIIRQAQNAIIYHDIISPLGAITLESETNEFSLNGVYVNIANAIGYTQVTSPQLDASGNPVLDASGNQVMQTTTVPGQVFTISTEQNIEDVMEMIREFVESYNELIRNLNSLHTTPRPTQRGNRSFFEPLTDEQRGAMSEREIERWEEQARTGLLHRDPMIRNLHNELRSLMFNPVTLADGTQLALFNIGINTVGMNGSREDRMTGVLSIDEDRLREALASNPEGVQALFSRSPAQADVPFGTAAERNAAHPNVGVAWRLRNAIQSAVVDANGPFRQRVGAEGLTDDSSNLVARQLRDYDDRIERMQQFLIRRENHFFQMFARMEQAMSQSQAQMESLWAFAGM